MSDLIGNHEDRFSRVTAHFIMRGIRDGSRPHYENLPMQYKDFFFQEKNKKNIPSDFFFFIIFARNIHRGYTLEPRRRGGSNEYPQCMFLIKNKKT